MSPHVHLARKCVASLLAGALFAQTPVQEHGDLAVAGNRVVDSAGSPVSLAGMSLFWSNTGWGGEAFYNAAAVQWARDDWGVQLIRAAMGVEAPGGFLSDPSNRDKVAVVVDAAVQAGIYVIIDWHSHHAEDYEAEAVAFFTDMATQYGHLPNVIYEIYNEPLSSGNNADYWSDTIKPYAEAVIDAVRAIDPDNLIVVGTPRWSQDVDLASLDPITGRANIAYTLHFYAATHAAALRQKALVALGNDLPLFVTEWGAVEANAQGSVDYQSVAEWMDFLCEHEISHCNWALNDKNEAASALVQGVDPSGGWSANEWTASGALVKGIVEQWGVFCSDAALTTRYGVGCPPSQAAQVEVEQHVLLGGGAAVVAANDPEDPTGQGLIYSAVGDFSVHAPLFMSQYAAADYLVELRYASAAGATLKFEARGGYPLYAALQLAPTVGFETVSQLVSLPHYVDPALAYDASSAGPVTVNWLRLSDPIPSMSLDAAGAPALGSSWALSAAGIEPAAPACLFWFGDVSYPAGVSLATYGADGCFGYTNGNLAATLVAAAGGGSSTTLQVPAAVALTGFELSVQASAASSAVPVGFATSNGVVGRVGL